MSYLSQKTKYNMLNWPGALHWWAALLMSNTTVASEPDKDNLAAYSNLDECDAAGYARIQITSSIAITRVDGSRLVKVTATSPVWTALAARSRPLAGVLILIDTTGTNSAATNVPYAFDNVGFPQDPPVGQDFPWIINVNGFVSI